MMYAFLFNTTPPLLSPARSSEHCFIPLLGRQNAVYRRYGAEIVVLSPLYQMHMYNLCHNRLILPTNIQNNNYIRYFDIINFKSSTKIKRKLYSRSYALNHFKSLSKPFYFACAALSLV